MNQRIIQRWFGISDVSDNADSESALYRHTDINFQRYVYLIISPVKQWALSGTTLIWNQRCIRQYWFRISAVCDSTDSETALYLTARADSGIFTFEYEYLREFETEFENILGCESGAHMESIHEKKQ